ncbi:MAG: DUF1653 domain-containing protein [Microgenomates group bacterium]
MNQSVRIRIRIRTVSKLWVRPLKTFLEKVEINGKKVPRFKYIGE